MDYSWVPRPPPRGSGAGERAAVQRSAGWGRRAVVSEVVRDGRGSWQGPSWRSENTTARRGEDRGRGGLAPLELARGGHESVGVDERARAGVGDGVRELVRERTRGLFGTVHRTAVVAVVEVMLVSMLLHEGTELV